MRKSSLTLVYHAACFDGVASAAIFSAFARERLGVGQVVLARDDYGAGPLDASQLGPHSAVVDFKFSADPRVRFWADHHNASGALDTADARAAYEARCDDPQIVFDPGAPSCAGLLARELAGRFGWDSKRYAELARECDLIDAARYETLSEALDLENAPARIALALDDSSSPDLEHEIIEGLARGSAIEAAGGPRASAAIAYALGRFEFQRDTFRRLATISGGVVEMDLSRTAIARPHKFLPYSLSDDVVFDVKVVRLPTGVAIKCGRNFWHPLSDRMPSIGEVCREWGGGGHKGAGGIPVPGGSVEDARRVASEVAGRLRNYVALARSSCEMIDPIVSPGNA